MAFAKPPDRWIARHHPDLVDIKGNKRNRSPKAGRNMGGFAPGVAASNHKDVIVVMFHVKHSSLAEAKIQENRVEKILHIHLTNQNIKAHDGTPQILGQ